MATPEQQAAADALGITPEQLAQQLGSAPAPTQEVTGTPVADPEKERLIAELAVERQENQQNKRNLQTLESGRVVGSGGLGWGSNPATNVPDIGSIEPGIRWSYFNGLLTDEDIEKKVGPLLAQLLKAHEGGAI